MSLAIAIAVCAVATVALPGALATASASGGSVRVGSAARPPAGSRVIGTLPDSTPIRVTVALQPRDPAALAAYATAVATPGSRDYRHYLTVAQFAARFGPSAAAIETVEHALRGRGLSPGPASANGLSIPITGTAGQLADAFSTSFDRVRLPSGRTAFSNTAAPAFSASVASLVQGVLGLNSLTVPQPLGPDRAPSPAGHGNLAPRTSEPTPCSAASSQASATGAHTADQLAAAYQFSSLYGAGDEGSGQTIALYELQPYVASDISSYQTCYGTSASVTGVSVDGASPTTGSSGGAEVTLDIEDVLGLAPQANVIVYVGPNTGSGAYDTYSAIISADQAKVVSVSYGACETASNQSTYAAENTLFEEGATQGQTVLVASGDTGSEACHPNTGSTALAVADPASQPYVTGVGGTTLTTIGPPPTESVWDDSTAGHECSSGPCGGGGGISSVWAMPSYQSNAAASLNVTNSNSSGTPCAASSGDCREVPDVSADADPYTGYVIYLNGSWSTIGGTSAAAPTWAAFIALVNASSGCGGKPIGFANPTLYSVAGSAYAGDFHDITSGNNDVLDAHGGLYPAGTGYDMASGLGSPNGSTLPAALCSAATGPPTVGTLATVNLPAGATSMPTSVTIDPTNHIAYIDESNGNAVAEISDTTGTTFPATATDDSSVLPGLDFPDGLAVDSSGHVFASNFCVGTRADVCSGEPAGTSTAVSQQTGPSTGQQDVMSSCSFPSGDAVSSGGGSSDLFLNCAGSAAFAVCSTSTAPSSGGCGPSPSAFDVGLGAGAVPSGMATVPPQIYSSHPAVIIADAHNDDLTAIADQGGGSFAEIAASAALSSTCEPANIAVGPVTEASPAPLYTAAVYAACPGNGTIEVGTLSSNDGAVSLGGFAAVSVPTTGMNAPRPYGVAINAAGTVLAVTDAANNDAVVYPSVNGASLGEPGVVSVGHVPDGVGVDAANVFVANEGSGTITVLDPPARPTAGFTAHTRLDRSEPARPVSRTPLIAPLPGGWPRHRRG